MAGRKIDTVTVEVVRNLLMSIAEEANAIIIKSAYSTNIKERRDVAAAILDPDGNMVAQVESLAGLLGSLLTVVRNVYDKFGRENVHPGDMFIANDPYHGGGNHLPDIVVAAPAFSGGTLIGWIANIAHHSDIGGKVPGSTSGDADSVFPGGDPHSAGADFQRGQIKREPDGSAARQYPRASGALRGPDRPDVVESNRG